ncbi:molecular chaperone HtpG [Bacteriovorax sp. Seq25_V]|uniref:molecular chaperone HtpG n=1 Tax=Bacteriovorax sp. Seq25_V TaxID=1201288 RepID=UPI00038A1E95|nr:molecular chaperone HtpG [Bacteriovorax sp. Seq25_V]EQC46258.1 Hsp90 protein [Bacteriovorax sp. Seq25_V]
MTTRKGEISVSTKDIFPIIKKWLYSEHDIFLRELIANASDAITKRATMARTTGAELQDGQIQVRVNKDAKTVQVIDNGIGMTEAEVEKYIAQLAFSGAAEFVKKLEEAGGEKNNEIIGKFGLGFYSAFMVASKVEVDSLSMTEGAKPVKWTCEGDTEYSFEDGTQTEVGTTITLHINEESLDFLNKWKLKETLSNHCDFMPYAITLVDVNEKVKPKKEDGTVDTDAPEVAASPELINETKPIWKRDPSELTDEDYKNFYRKLYPMEGEPLFWIHLKVDHPFTLDGVLFFPKFNPTKPFTDKNIRLYCRQVFVSDNVKNIIPDFLGLLKGAIDSVDIPLNVSRSSLQGDPNISKISNYIVKKVAEALKKLAKKDREKYESIWNDIGLFVKYGCVSDNKFDEQMRERVLFKTNEGSFVTFGEYEESIPADYKEKMKNKVLYFEKDKADVTLLNNLKEAGIKAVETDDHIDPHFIQHAESHKIGDSELVKFTSVDSEIENILGSDNTTEDDIKVKEMFSKFLDIKLDDQDSMAPKGIEIAKIKNSTTAAYIKVDESMKRFGQMTKSMGQGMSFPVKRTLVINPQNPLVQNALKLSGDAKNEGLAKKICLHVEDLANISSEGLGAEQRELFVKRSQELIAELSSLAL